MAKSLRSKRKMRLRALRREIVEPHYEKKEQQKMAALDAAAEAPKVDVKMTTPATEAMVIETAPSTDAAVESSKMETDEDEGLDSYGRVLKPKGKSMKRGKSRSRAKKERRKHKKLKF